MIKKWLDQGTLSISEDVFAIIATIVIEEMEGIAGTVSDLRDNFKRVVHKKGNQRGIIVENIDDEVLIDIKVSIYFGVNICDLCLMLQKKIKEEIEMMTGIEVTAVNITVESIQFKSENKKDA